ncbi:hypothetical protein ACWCV5_28235 [Streptomyces tubercidicus]
MSESEAAAAAKKILEDACRSEPPVRHFPTSFRDETELPAYGPTPPVPQDDRRLVPAWAAGIAVASIGVGAGVTGIGCGAWLVLKGLSSVTLYGVLTVTLPFAGVAAVATAIGSVISKVRSATSKTVYEGPVYQHNETHNTSNQHGTFSRTRNDVR